MRKFTLLATMACALLGMPGFAQSASTPKAASASVYDFSGFSETKILELFAKVKAQGRDYPTLDEFKEIGILPSDLAFVRSHMRPRTLLSQANRVVQNTREGRDLWMNIPMGAGKGGDAGYPSGNFSADVYSMWNYTNLFGSWNHGLFTAPGCWVDAAHKHGTDIFSGIKFFDTTGGRNGSSNSWENFILAQTPDGKFTYAEPLINVLMYFGSDGINYNWEDSGYDRPEIAAFHQELWKIAKQKGFTNYHSGIYTSQSSLSEYNTKALFGDLANGGKTHDLMLNYSGDNFISVPVMQRSVDAAKKAMGTTEGLYASTWIVTMNRSWSNLSKNNDINICLWGEHGESRFMSYNKGKDAFDAQRNYQRLLERAFSGGNRNPLQRPAVSNTGNNWEQEGNKLPLQTFCGLAEFIPERSTVQGNLPFATHFNLGNGERFNYKGKKTAGSWYNMAAQDMMPTYRWLVYNAGTTNVSTAIQPEFSHDDAYIGGSCLELKGDASQATDIVLYQTNLKVGAANPVVKMAVKQLAGAGQSHLYAILKVDNNWVEVPYGEISGKTWEEKKISANLTQGSTISAIGLRVKGGSDKYQLNVGKLEINDDSFLKPAELKDLMVEVKAETNKSMTAKLSWGVDAEAKTRKANDLLYNDEANIDHFEVLYKNGQNGKVQVVGLTSQWAAIVPNFELEDGAVPYFGVRAVSADLKQYSTVKWQKVARDPKAPQIAEVDPYGVSAMNPNSEGAEIARQQRYVTDVTTTGATQDLNYHANAPVADGTQYADARNQVLKVKQGQKVTLTIKCFDTSNLTKKDGLRWCFAGGWMDLDGSKSFNPDPIATNPKEGEQIFKVGKVRAGTPEFETQGISTTFEVPADARPGRSRLRIVFSDAWFAGAFLPTGLHNKGFTIDFGVEIEGDNQGRIPNDFHDQGAADEPDRIKDEKPNVPTAINKVYDEVSHANYADGVLQFTNVQQAWVYGADGKFVLGSNGESINTQDLVPGVYLVKMQNKGVIRSAKFVVK